MLTLSRQMVHFQLTILIFLFLNSSKALAVSRNVIGAEQSRNLRGGTFFCELAARFPNRPILRRIGQRFNCISVMAPVDCAPFINEVAELGDVVDRASNTLVFAVDMLRNISCAALVANVNATANETVADFTVAVCEEAKRQTITALSEGGECANALAAIENNSTSNGTGTTTALARFPSPFTKHDLGNRHLQQQPTCGGSDAGCNDLTTCQFLSAVCRPAGGEIVNALATAGAALVANYYRATLAALALTLSLKIGATPTLFIVGALVLAFEIAVAETQSAYCADALKQCTNAGTAAGLDCKGAACCPDETGTECGFNCCCCGFGLAPRGPSCECVAAA